MATHDWESSPEIMSVIVGLIESKTGIYLSYKYTVVSSNKMLQIYSQFLRTIRKPQRRYIEYGNDAIVKVRSYR